MAISGVCIGGCARSLVGTTTPSLTKNKRRDLHSWNKRQRVEEVDLFRTIIVRNRSQIFSVQLHQDL